MRCYGKSLCVSNALFALSFFFFFFSFSSSKVRRDTRPFPFSPQKCGKSGSRS